MALIKVTVMGLIAGTSEMNYSLLLEDVNSKRRLPILIGAYEAQAIALALEPAKVKRPFTHDLMAQFIELSNIELSELRIHSLKEGVFMANLIYQKNGKEEQINCRPSDGIALALRLNFEVWVEKHLLDDFGITKDDLPFLEDIDEDEMPGRPSEDNQQPVSKSFEDLLKDFKLPQLEKMLEDAEENEDYEKAAKIRDEINKRN